MNIKKTARKLINALRRFSAWMDRESLRRQRRIADALCDSGVDTRYAAERETDKLEAAIEALRQIEHLTHGEDCYACKMAHTVAQDAWRAAQ